jgi:hypothetical protein
MTVIQRRNSNVAETFPATLVPPAFPTPATFYTDIPILDSNNNTGHWVNLSGSIGAQAIQLFRCSLSLVEQTALLDAQSHELISVVGPAVDKTTSAWQPFAAAHSQNLSDIAFGTPEGFLDIVRVRSRGALQYLIFWL